jgi:hypothetical protein
VAAEHVLEELLRKVAPYARAGLEHDIQAAEKLLDRARESLLALDSDASATRVASAKAKYARACADHDRLTRLREDLKEALRRG